MPGHSTGAAVEFLEIEGRENLQQRKPRLDFLDWLRFLLVVGVVYAHTAKSGLKGGGGFNVPWLIDDRTLYDDPSYSAVHGTIVPAPLAVRWISLTRQWCIPLLFWVSGASTACSYKGGRPRNLDKLLIFSAIGMSLNAILWFLGPLDDQCEVDAPQCASKGLVFNFTVVPFAGFAFAVIFQMWYTLVLALFSILNWPLFTVMHGRKPWVLGIQFLATMAIQAALVLNSSSCQQPTLLLVWLAVLEVAFLTIVAMCASALLVPTRVAHYFLALITLAQFGALPFAKEMSTIGPAYISFIVTGFNRFFGLGFVMTLGRSGPLEAKPLVSRCWPCAIIICTLVAPSTNWDQAGMLTYPFFRQTMERCLYVSGALVVCFVIDRCSRGVECDPLPRVLGHIGLALYLFHPVFITLFLSLGFRSVQEVWLSSVVSTAAMIFVMFGLRRRACWGRRKGAEEHHGEGSSSSSEVDGAL